MTITILIGYLAAGLQISRALPQVARLVRTRDVTGVSAFSWALVMLNGIYWSMYAVPEHLIPTLVSNGVAGALGLIILALLGRKALVLVVPVVGVSLVSLWVMPVGVLGVAAVVTTFFVYIPQAVASFRSDLSGVSLGTWVISLGTTLCWALYGSLVHSWPVIAPSFVAVPLTLLIIAKVLRYRSSTACAELVLSSGGLGEPNTVTLQASGS
jgi:uncharacterized protein with PQ loop repeat